MISTTAEYALRAVLLLAMRNSDDALRANEIADAISAPRNYLSKTLRVLARVGVIEGTRGPRGGFRLAADPRSITIAALVDLFDDARCSKGCLVVDCDCAASSPCGVHRWWNQVEDAGRSTLESTTIAQLVRSRSHITERIAVVPTRRTGLSARTSARTTATIPARAAVR
jgi:Rrf2 family protein